MHRLFFFIFPLVVIFLQNDLFAVDEPPVQAAPTILHEYVQEEEGKQAYNFMDEFSSMMSTVAVLLVAVLVLAWIMKRVVKTREAQLNLSSNIKVLERRVLSPRSNIYLLEVGESVLLIGESAAGVHALADLSKDYRDESGGISKNFKEILDNRPDDDQLN